jgi:hypothetical protein
MLVEYRTTYGRREPWAVGMRDMGGGGRAAVRRREANVRLHLESVIAIQIGRGVPTGDIAYGGLLAPYPGTGVEATLRGGPKPAYGCKLSQSK